MNGLSVLFVDDEQDIRANFRNRFDKQFRVSLAADGLEALQTLRRDDGFNVVVTDIRMPNLSGLELIRQAKEVDADLSFIVVSGHGETEDIVAAFRLGARNFLRKPYRFAELEQAILEEGERYHLIRQQRIQMAEEKTADRYLAGVQELTYELPTSLDWISAISLRLVQIMEATGVCSADDGANVALGLVEILTNAIEHGNLGINAAEKVALKSKGEQVYQAELKRRMAEPSYQRRKVLVRASMSRQQARVTVVDEGAGFDFNALPDPTDPENLFKPSGRGILLAQNLVDELNFQGVGNTVTVVKHRRPVE